MLVFSTLQLYITKSRWIKCLIFQKDLWLFSTSREKKKRETKRKREGDRDRGSRLLALGFNSDISGLGFNHTTLFCAS